MPTENRSSNTEMVSDKLPPCADDVFKDGVSACLVGDVPKHAAETICQSLSAVTGWKIDWHYFGGRTHIKALAPAPKHPEPIAWMVGTAFWWTKEEAERDAAATGLPIIGLGPMTGAEPAEQRQVDQVVNAEQVLGAYQFASFGPANHLRGTTNWCAAFAQELNHRIGADTAEVEQIGKELREVREERDDLCRRVDDFQSRTHGIKNLSAIEQLTDKLAERDALLTKMKALFRADDPFDLYDAVCAVLPASAEPRATTPQTINGHKLNCKAVDDYKPGQCSCAVEIDHEIPGTSFQRLNALANQGE